MQTAQASLWARAGLLGALALALVLAAGRPAPAHGAFAGVNGKIAFASTRDGDDEIYTMHPDGSNVQQLTFNAVGDSHPGWSADGFRIVFDSARDDPLLDLYSMNAYGNNQARLIVSPTFEDWEGAWSPDGTQIAFGSTRDGDFDVWRINADGSNPTQLVNAADIDRHVVYSPDGTKIAFRAGRDGNGEVYTANADGTNQVNISNNAAFDSRPSWSPDGTKIAFNTVRDGNSEIYVMDADGSNQTRLTNNPAADDTPAWSPDGTKIAFVSTRTNNSEIFVMDANGANPVNMTNNPAEDTWPDWQSVTAVGGNAVLDAGVAVPASGSGPGIALLAVLAVSLCLAGASWYARRRSAS